MIGKAKRLSLFCKQTNPFFNRSLFISLLEQFEKAEENVGKQDPHAHMGTLFVDGLLFRRQGFVAIWGLILVVRRGANGGCYYAVAGLGVVFMRL